MNNQINESPIEVNRSLVIHRCIFFSRRICLLRFSARDFRIASVSIYSTSGDRSCARGALTLLRLARKRNQRQIPSLRGNRLAIAVDDVRAWVSRKVSAVN